MASGDLGVAVKFATVLLVHTLRPIYLHQAQAAGAKPLPPLQFMMFIDAAKLAACFVFLLLGRAITGKWDKVWYGFRHTLVLVVPAMLNFTAFTLTIYATSVLPPPLFLLTASMAIVGTAVTNWLFLECDLTPQQWSGLLLLACGTAVGQWNGISGNDGTLMPVMAVLTTFWLSSLGSAYTEKVLKKGRCSQLDFNSTALHMSVHALIANVGLSVLMPLVISIGPYERIAWTGDYKEMTGTMLPWGPFWIIMAVANEALSSIVMSSSILELKREEAIAKNYVYCSSIFIALPISMLFFGYALDTQFIIGAGLVQHAVMLYGRATEASMDDKKAD